MFIFAFSFRVGYLFSSEHFLFLVFLIQTFLYVITFAFYHKFINRIFVYILRNIDNKMINSLVVISFSWFFIIFLLNFTLSEGDSLVLAIFMLFVIIINAILSYQLVYKLVSVNNKAKELSQITQIDTLTQLKNREGFLKDVFPKIDNNECFTIIFMDLDNFKQVNDNFGHAVGDAYLVEFVKKVKASMNKEDGFYRLHGDEFVLLIDGCRVERICRRVEGMEFLITPEGVSFKGISYGYATFPEDGTTISDLMHLADFRMYQKKKVKHNK
ncbi:MAG: GGDEF domain-containing protein [Solirubrobacterales bacterium]